MHTHTYADTHDHFLTIFPGPSMWASARRNLLDFYGAREDNRGRYTDHLAWHHSIWTNRRPISIIPIFMPVALPAATLPRYPGLGQAQNMLASILSDVVWVDITATCSMETLFCSACLWLSMCGCVHDCVGDGSSGIGHWTRDVPCVLDGSQLQRSSYCRQSNGWNGHWGGGPETPWCYLQST